MVGPRADGYSDRGSGVMPVESEIGHPVQGPCTFPRAESLPEQAGGDPAAADCLEVRYLVRA